MPDVKISLANFGPIASGTLDLRPLTVLVGPSGTGKTYLATLLYALHRSFSGFPRHPLKSRHFMNEIDSSSQDDFDRILRKLARSDRPFTLTDLPPTVHAHMERILLDPGNFVSALISDLTRCLSVSRIQDLIRWHNQDDSLNLSLEIADNGRSCWNFFMEILHPSTNRNSKFMQATRENILDDSVESISVHGKVDDPILIPIKQWNRKNLRQHLEDSIPEYLDPVRKLRIIVNELLGATGSFSEDDAHYLPAARGGIMQADRFILSSLVGGFNHAVHEKLARLPVLTGTVSDFIQKIVLYDESGISRNSYSNDLKSGSILRNFVRSTKHSSRTIGEKWEQEILGGQVIVKTSPFGNLPEFKFLPVGSTKDIFLRRASSMVAELAPLFLFLRGVVRRGDTLILEEPEAHLHPESQAMLAKTLADVVQSGVNVVVTTHSDWFLKEIGNLILEGKLQSLPEYTPFADSAEPCFLRKSQVGVWHFLRDAKDHCSKIEEIPFDFYDGVEPRQFEEISEHLYNRAVDLRNCIWDPGRPFRR